MKLRTKNSDLLSQPTVVAPMLATLVKEPFNDKAYVYEVKWDGYRILAFCKHGLIKLQSRGGEDYTKKYPSVVRSLKTLNLNCIIDGEVVYINTEGKPDFDALQRVNGQQAPIVYYVFDLLWLEGDSLMKLPLLERKHILQNTVLDNDTIKYSDHFEDGLTLFDHVKTIGLEGIVAKRKDSQYLPNDRSKKWLKIMTDKKQEFVIGGWVESEKRNTFRTLLFGAYENGVLKWKGHAGGGFKEKDMPRILKRLQEIEIDKNPFDSDVEYSEGKPHWVKPELVANIKFSTTTRSGKIRKPAIFLGFRDDKRATQVTTEVAHDPPATSQTKHLTHNSQKPAVRKPTSKQRIETTDESNWPQLESEPIRNKDTVELEECTVTLHNVDRVIWKGITKADLIQYYHQVSSVLLPHIKNRPLSLHVKPKGPNAPGLYIKDMEGRQPECADIFSTSRKHKKAGKRDVIDYLVCNNTPTLLYVINLGCIDVNPWTSVVESSLNPDYIVIDLDPSDGDFKKAIETANAAKVVFDKYKLKGFPKTSGKSGIHLFLPCIEFSFPQARTIAEQLCDEIHLLVPEITTTTVTVSDRGNKLYLDPNQNDYTDTVACAYSLRPYKQPTCSAPLQWNELKSDIDPSEFNIHTMPKRIQKKGDLFAATLDKKIAAANTNHLRLQFLKP
jgi:bifunctional non-homologous end joining protein LigD